MFDSRDVLPPSTPNARRHACLLCGSARPRCAQQRSRTLWRTSSNPCVLARRRRQLSATTYRTFFHHLPHSAPCSRRSFKYRMRRPGIRLSFQRDTTRRRSGETLIYASTRLQIRRNSTRTHRSRPAHDIVSYDVCLSGVLTKMQIITSRDLGTYILVLHLAGTTRCAEDLLKTQ